MMKILAIIILLFIIAVLWMIAHVMYKPAYDKFRKEFQNHQETKNSLTIQIDKKRTWIKIAVGSLLVNGTLIYIITR